MIRNIEKYLLDWKLQEPHLPLLVRGARQVGKTYTIEKFGREQFESLVSINFEFQPELKPIFDSLNPKEILSKLELFLKVSVSPGKTLLFLDEIQECPNAILALRYFKEQLPDLHVIGAGSLLEFILNDERFRTPVGRVQFIYLYPMSFEECLEAQQYHKLKEYVSELSLNSKRDETIHSQLLKLVRIYMAMGGMPAVVNHYIEKQTFAGIEIILAGLLNGYQHDFGKYASKTKYEYLQRIFTAIPRAAGQTLKYVSLDPELRSYQVQSVLDHFVSAGLIHSVKSTSASGVPLGASLHPFKQKLLFLDIGLWQRASHFTFDVSFDQDVLFVHRGLLAEQFAGQELLAYSPPYVPGQLYFWSREKKNSQAEVDYVIQLGELILPIEVKSGTTGQLRSLQIFMQEKKSPLGIRIYQGPLSFENNVLSVPFYMIEHIPRLVRSLIKP